MRTLPRLQSNTAVGRGNTAESTMAFAPEQSAHMSTRLAIIVPVLDEAAGIAALLGELQPLRARGVRVVVVDGGSRDATVVLASPLADRVIQAPRGRALQMNAGARAPEAQDADVLLFLHADTHLPPEADRVLLPALDNSRRCWGRFDVTITGEAAALRLVAAFMNVRSRLTGIATGDQAIFVRRSAFSALDGFAPIPLMEDIEFCTRAKGLSPPLALRQRVTTSGRRWEAQGVWRTILLMWRLRLEYFLGADPAKLAQRYRLAR
jgi:rSAM/selenodomain-associated transferase 2